MNSVMLKLYLLPLIMLLFLQAVQAQENGNFCQGQTPLEQSYCKLVELGATGLPALYEFRKNSPQTQYLLLKRPASRHGITLTAPANSKTQVSKPEATQPKPEAVATKPEAVATKPVEKVKVSKAATPTATSFNPAPKLISLTSPGECQLQGESISCAKERFTLQWNKPKQALSDSALSAGNQLVFPPAPTSAGQIEDYLLRCYLAYIQKMLTLGLGNTTLSYTKFANIYYEAKSQNFDFAARFNKMYHYLKEERKTMSPPKGFGQAKPQRIDDCLKLSESIWSCQTTDHHWIFAKG